MLPPDFNIAPTTYQPVIRQNRDTLDRELVLMQWSLVPNYTKDLKTLRAYSTINARAEGIPKAQMWRTPIRKHRCLVPADGFYEWRRPDPKTKIPYAFRVKDKEPFAFAGIWDAWKETPEAVATRIKRERDSIELRMRLLETVVADDTVDSRAVGKIAGYDPDLRERLEAQINPSPQWLQSFAIITTDANEAMAPIHDRMPVILHPKDYDRWLDRGEVERPPIDLLRPYEAEEMASALANKLVGNAKNNGPAMLNSAEPPPPSSSTSLPLIFKLFDPLRQLIEANVDTTYSSRQYSVLIGMRRESRRVRRW